MNLGSRGPVVIDTGVFGARLTPSGRLLAALYRPILEGRPAVISFVTVAELEYGARLADWGPDRVRRLEYEVGRAEIVWPGPHLTDVYANLRGDPGWRPYRGPARGYQDVFGPLARTAVPDAAGLQPTGSVRRPASFEDVQQKTQSPLTAAS